MKQEGVGRGVRRPMRCASEGAKPEAASKLKPKRVEALLGIWVGWRDRSVGRSVNTLRNILILKNW